ncbi:hypothetical protein TNCT_178221 [Trichonephila clavata]|uniref:Uncharacterized protein n=1 Tax=Trichonephila clavata TaxID=2740835 RepID=A0A8X6LPH6_TRICU|nr:hypothetical protein TNCT_178221 [Trichonephila clavata]
MAAGVTSFCVTCFSELSSEKSVSSISESSLSERVEMGVGSGCSERAFFPRPPDLGETVARLSFVSCLGLRAEAAVGTCLGLEAEVSVGAWLGLVTEAASISLSCSSLANRSVNSRYIRSLDFLEHLYAAHWTSFTALRLSGVSVS